jgi:hypothetical protein
MDPSAIGDAILPHLREIDVLRHYLQSLPGPPCEIDFVIPTEDPNASPPPYANLAFLGPEIVPFSKPSPDEATEVAEMLDGGGQSLRALVFTALTNDIDAIVGTTPPARFEPDRLVQAIGLTLEDWKEVKRSCEVFVRGHDIPWSFGYPAWGCPWTPFYSIAEPDRKLISRGLDQWRKLLCGRDVSETRVWSTA